MSIKEETICRVCLNVADKEFEVIDEVTREIFDVLLLEMNLDVNDNAVICHQCSESAKKSFYFKSVCIDTEKCVMLFAINKPEDGFEMKDIYEKKNVEVVDKNFNICRFCMKLLEKNNFISVDSLMEEVTVAEMSIFLPEMDSLIIKNSVACSTCRDNLECYFQLASICLDTEMNTYSQDKGSNSTNQVKLSNILQHFLYRNKSGCIENKYTHRYLTEQEPDIEKINLNELNIKGEVTTNEDCENSLDILHSCDKEYMRLLEDISKEKVHKCTLCTYETKYKSSLNRHMLIHKDVSQVKMYKCTKCGYETKYRSRLTDHMIIHKDPSEIKTYKCTECTYEANYRRSFKDHMLSHKDVSEVKIYNCTQCTYETRYKNRFYHHSFTHKDISEVKMHKCTECSYVTRFTSHLKNHILTHKDISELNMYKCTECPYEAKYSRSLKGHMLVHKDISEVTMYKCTYCTFETKHKNNLKYHIITHTGISKVNVHKCAMCDYETRYKGNLKKHIMVKHKNISEVELYK